MNKINTFPGSVAMQHMDLLYYRTISYTYLPLEKARPFGNSVRWFCTPVNIKGTI